MLRGTVLLTLSSLPFADRNPLALCGPIPLVTVVAFPISNKVSNILWIAAILTCEIAAARPSSIFATVLTNAT